MIFDSVRQNPTSLVLHSFGRCAQKTRGAGKIEPLMIEMNDLRILFVCFFRQSIRSSQVTHPSRHQFNHDYEIDINQYTLSPILEKHFPAPTSKRMKTNGARKHVSPASKWAQKSVISRGLITPLKLGFK